MKLVEGSAMTQAIERRDEGTLALRMWGSERLQVLKSEIAPGASDAELELFAEVCRRTRLDPFAKQIWSIQRRRNVGDQRNPRWENYQVIQIGVHGLRLIAQRSGEYAGQLGPFFMNEDGDWSDTWLDETPPKAARVGVRRKGWLDPVTSVAVWDRSVQKTSSGLPMARWATNGPEMLALAAERDALRRAFPIETADLEIIEEQQQDARAERYREIFGDEESGTAYDLPQQEQAQRITERARSAAEQRQLDLAEVDRQRRQEGLV